MTMRPSTARLLTCAFTLAVSLPAAACTTFTATSPDGLLFGRNYDYPFGDGLLVVNPRGLARHSGVSAGTAKWVSRYGSVTFNQYGVGYPTGGVNEKGLIVELLWHEAARYPDEDGRPVVASLEYIQNLLDRAASVDEALLLADAIRISDPVTIHFLLADSSGQTATLEFIDGKRVSRTGDSLPVPVLANDSYSDSMDYLRQFRGFGGEASVPEGSGSLDRFARAATLIGANNESKRTTVEDGFGVLDAVAQPNFTQWQIVYDLGKQAVHYRTGENRRPRRLQLASIDFSCHAPAQLLDIHAGSGKVNAKLKPFSTEANLRLITASYSKTPFLEGVPKEAYAQQAKFPETFRCVETWNAP